MPELIFDHRPGGVLHEEDLKKMDEHRQKNKPLSFWEWVNQGLDEDEAKIEKEKENEGSNSSN